MLLRERWIGLGLAGLALAGCQPEQQRQPPAERPLVIVAAEPVPSAESVTLTGSIAARSESSLSFRTGGRIVERLVDVGDQVVRGQVLARIDPQVQRAGVEAARAQLASAQAEVAQAASAFSRAESLFTRGYTTRREFDLADQSLKVAQADRASAEARLASAEESLSFAELRADAAGVVTARDLDVGETAQAAARVFTVALDGSRDAVFDIYEGLLLGGREPPEIVVTLVTDPRITARGRIRQVAPSVDPQSATVRVKVGLDDTPPAMTLGSAVTGTAALPSAPVFVLPSAAMASLEGRPAVWVVDPDSGEVAMRAVRTLAYTSDTVTLDEGLRAGDRVVVEGTKLLRPGERIALPTEPVAKSGFAETTR